MCKTTTDSISSEDQYHLWERAWKYWEYHAQQRLLTFRYFLGFLTALGGLGVYAVTKLGGSYWQLFIGIIMSIIAFLFAKIDQRNSKLIKNAEAVIKELECSSIGKSYWPGTFTRADEVLEKSNDISDWSYSQCFKRIFGVFFILGLLIAISPMFH